MSQIIFKFKDDLQAVLLLSCFVGHLVGWGGECVTPVLVRSLKLSTLVHSQ